jgi:hypothetical protein
MRTGFAGWISFIFFLHGCSGKYFNDGPSPMDSVQKIFIERDQVYDLSGYAGGGGGNPYNLFDENAFTDPRYERMGNIFLPETNCQPTDHPAIYFHGTEGNRIVVDLKIPYSVKEIYFYDRSRQADSFWIYTGSLRKWKSVASCVTVSESGNWGWKKIVLNEETRFLMIRFSSYESAVTEMVLYGVAKQEIPRGTDFSVHKGFTKTTLDKFLGVNYIMESEPQWLRPFHYSRIYNFALDYDNDTARDENRVRFNMLHYGFYNRDKAKYIFDIDTLKNINQGNIWFSIRGVSGWMSKLGFTDKDRPVNHPSLNSEMPACYSRHAAMMWNMAAFFGYQQIDTNLLSLSNEPRQSGRGSMNLFENGNEEDATWVGNKYCSPIEYYAQSTADWDGDENRTGDRHGIHRADPNALLMMSGLTGLDTNRVKVYRLLSENLRDDRNFIWQGGIQYHYYAERNNRGISPEADSMRYRLSKVADCSFRIAPHVKCILGENGYDKSPVSRQATPLIPGLSAAQSQGVMLLRSINACFFSGFDAYILYWLRDGNPQDDPRVYLTSGLLRTRPDGTTQVYPGWYYISTMVNRLGKYRADKVMKEDGGVWVYKYRNSERPDSVAYFLYRPLIKENNTILYCLKEGQITGNDVLKVEFSDESVFGNSTPLQVKDGQINVEIAEKPVLILCKEGPVGR